MMCFLITYNLVFINRQKKLASLETLQFLETSLLESGGIKTCSYITIT